MTTNAQINQVVALLQVGELAMQMCRADARLKQAREAYYGEVKRFEEKFAGGRRLQVDPGNPMYTQRRAFTQYEFLMLESAKKKAYRAKRKLLQACAKMVDGGAQ
jgi:hypothetical protein